MNKIREARKKQGLSQDDVAKYLHTTRQAISLYERGDRQPKLDVLKKMATLLKTSVGYLQGTELSDEDKLNICLKLISHSIVEKNPDVASPQAELGRESRLYLDAINRITNLEVLLNDKKLSVDNEIVQNFFKVNFSSVVNINSVSSLAGFRNGVVNDDFLQLQLSGQIKYSGLSIAYPILKNITDHAKELSTETAELFHSRAIRSEASLPASVISKLENSRKKKISKLILKLQEDMKIIEDSL